MNGLGGVNREEVMALAEEGLQQLSLRREEDLSAISARCVEWHVSYYSSFQYRSLYSEKLNIIARIQIQAETARNRLEKLVSSIVELVKQHLHERDEAGIFSKKQERRLIEVCTPLFSRADVRHQLIGLSADSFSLFQGRVQEHFSRLIKAPSSIEKCLCGNYYQLASYASLPPELARVWIDEAVRTHGLVEDIRERFNAQRSPSYSIQSQEGEPLRSPTPPLPDY